MSWGRIFHLVLIIIIVEQQFLEKMNAFNVYVLNYVQIYVIAMFLQIILYQIT